MAWDLYQSTLVCMDCGEEAKGSWERDAAGTPYFVKSLPFCPLCGGKWHWIYKYKKVD